MLYKLYVYVYIKIVQSREILYNWYLVYQINELKNSKDVVNIITRLNIDTTDGIIHFLTSFFRVYGCHIKESTLKRLNELRKTADGLHNHEEYAIILLWSCIIEASSQKLIDFK